MLCQMIGNGTLSCMLKIYNCDHSCLGFKMRKAGNIRPELIDMKRWMLLCLSDQKIKMLKTITMTR